jgi:SAM-dependent methyltransferase
MLSPAPAAVIATRSGPADESLMVLQVTDKALLRRRLARAHERPGGFADFLHRAVAADLAERLAGVERQFPLAIAHAGQTGGLAEALAATGRVGQVVRLEPAQAALAGAAAGMAGAVADEEALPLAPASVELFVSALALQWTNDLPGALVQIRQALKPDGLFLAALTGGQTLAELREALVAAETELRGGASPRILPAAKVRDLGALLQRAGFALPVADRDVLIVRYDSAFALFADLRAMGASNALMERERRPATRRLFLRAAEIYAERFSDPDGRVRASFEIVSLSGWAPHESQQQPARRGSAQVSLAEVLKPPRRDG